MTVKQAYKKAQKYWDSKYEYHRPWVKKVTIESFSD